MQNSSISTISYVVLITKHHPVHAETRGSVKMLLKKNYIPLILVTSIFAYAVFDSRNNNQSFVHWAWQNEPWFFFLLIAMFPGMMALLYWVVRKIYN